MTIYVNNLYVDEEDEALYVEENEEQEFIEDFLTGFFITLGFGLLALTVVLGIIL